MILWGTLASHSEVHSKAGRKPALLWLLTLCGAMLALYIFMADSIAVAGQGTAALRNVLPTRFNWPLFTVALLLMAAPMPRLISLHIRTFATERQANGSECNRLP
jgi:hypothetical protein